MGKMGETAKVRVEVKMLAKHQGSSRATLQKYTRARQGVTALVTAQAS
jgi:hypothetical protein